MGDGEPSDTPKSADGSLENATPQEIQKALLRKVAQLTKVVVHLTSRNDESELQYLRLSEAAEHDMQQLLEKAEKEMQSEFAKLEDLASKTCLQENADRLESLFGQQRQELAAELQNLRQLSAATRACAVDKAAEQLRHGSRVVRDLQRRLQNSIEAFRESLRAKSAEMQQRHAEMWQDRQGELQGYAEDFQRRLEELKASQRREADHVQQSTEQSVLQMRRMHEAEMSSWQMQALNRRSERIHRLEHEFAEERRLKEQAAQNAEHELAQVQKDLLDFKASYRLVDQQVDSLRGTLEEMRRRAHQAQKDADQAFEEANQAEANIATLAQDIAMLEVRRGSDSPTAVLPPKPPKPKPPRAPGLTEELREAIASHKHLEAELAQLEAQLGDLEDELAEKDKTVEILEVETEEERLRTHRLQARILQLEQALS